MKTYRPLFWFFFLLAFVVVSCQKERSLENGGGAPSDGSLQSGTTGDCLGSVVTGTYKKDTTLTSANYVDVKVDVVTGGSYIISSDTINGFYFRAAGTFTTTGVNTVRLQGKGKPVAEGTNIFTLTYDSTQCTFSVTTLPAGGGGTSVFTLAGSPGNCTPGTAAGSYNIGTALTSANTVTIQVNVTTAGTYSIVTSTVGGMTFSGSGTFPGTGTQTIVLTGSGTPPSAGTFTFPITAGSSSCSFSVTVTSLSNDYYPRTINSNWSYEFDDNPTDTLYRKVISATKSALGNTYNIFMENDGTGFDSSGYFRKSGGDYYQYADIGFIFGLDNEVWGEYIFIKDNVAAGTTWTSGTFSGVYTDPTTSVTYPIIVRVKETIQQKDVPVTINGTAYPNTIVIKEEYEYTFDTTGATGWTGSDVYSIYNFSRNIGLIKWEAFDTTGSIVKEEITRSQVF
jgi:hypothetical protein